MKLHYTLDCEYQERVNQNPNYVIKCRLKKELKMRDFCKKCTDKIPYFFDSEKDASKENKDIKQSHPKKEESNKQGLERYF